MGEPHIHSAPYPAAPRPGAGLEQGRKVDFAFSKNMATANDDELPYTILPADPSKAPVSHPREIFHERGMSAGGYSLV